MDIDKISGNFLIAVPGLRDPYFHHSVVLVCEHSEEGTFGLIINKVLMNSIKPLLNALELEGNTCDMPVYYGGPVRPDQGYVIYSPYNEKYGQMMVNEVVGVTASRLILYDIAEGKGPERFIFILGFSGWSPKQLEEEIMMDSWLIAPFDYKILFDLPVSERWHSAAKLIGVRFDRFFEKSGSA